MTLPPVRFPIKWLTYKKRMRRDLERAYEGELGESLFTPDYAQRLAGQVKQSEERFSKLCLLQFGLVAFQTIGFLSNDTSISLFGITFRQAAGVKEILLVVYATVAIATWAILMSRDTGLIVLDRWVELDVDGSVLDLTKLAVPAAFNIRFYFPKQYEDWIFATWFVNLLMISFACMLGVMMLVWIVASFTINAVIFLDIYRHPTIGIWSYISLVYALAAFCLGLLFLCIFYFPLPYSDQSAAKRVADLKESGDARYPEALEEVYGANSEYRRYSWRRRVMFWVLRR